MSVIDADADGTRRTGQKGRNQNYSREELVAEMGAAFLCGETGIENAATQQNTVAYLESWRKVLKTDTKAVVIAAAQAQKAADMILGKSYSQV